MNVARVGLLVKKEPEKEPGNWCVGWGETPGQLFRSFLLDGDRLCKRLEPK